ncbi:hypothetical protein HDU93_005294 [Gonapodya sp. JEL0774]|nr:hypothetical protein HDU93_005294 [Gonapodya sp. JEL0774]
MRRNQQFYRLLSRRSLRWNPSPVEEYQSTPARFNSQSSRGSKDADEKLRESYSWGPEVDVEKLHPALPRRPTWSIARDLLPTQSSTSPSTEDPTLAQSQLERLYYLARLAGLHVDPSDAPKLSREFDSLVQMIRKVQDTDVRDVEPFVSFVREPGYLARAQIDTLPEEETGTSTSSKGDDLTEKDGIGHFSDEEHGRDLLKHASRVKRDAYYVVQREVRKS